MKQKTLFKLSDYSSDFGGELLRKKRKSKRPLSNKNSMHTVLSADIRGTGSLLKYREAIESSFRIFAKRFGIKIYRKAIASNHIHLVALYPTRHQYRSFIRAIAGSLAKKLNIKWHLRPWTRILNWGKAFATALKYVLQNHSEATKQIPYKKRKGRHVHRSG